MNYKILIILLIISCFSCKTSPFENSNSTKLKKTEKIMHTIKNKEWQKDNQDFDSLIIVKQKFSLSLLDNHNKYISDTLNISGFELIIYGEFFHIDLNNYYQFVYIDSIKVLKPIKSILKSEGTGGYLYKDKGYQFDDIIKISDVNRDGNSDINVYNDAKSGTGQNSTYDVWLNKGEKLVYSQEFSIPNLKYNNKTDEYYSRGSGGGGNYVETFYKLVNNKLKAIREKIRGYNSENDGYRILEINLISNDTIKNEMEYVR